MIKKIINKVKSLDKTKILSTLRKKWIGIFIILLCLLLCIGYIVGKQINLKNDLLSKLEVSLKDSDVDLLSSLVEVNGKRVDKEVLEPIIEYYRGDGGRVDATISNLKNKLETPDMKLESNKFLFWDRYYLNIMTYNIKVNSNYQDGIFTINGESITTGGELGNLIPGVYTVDGVLNGKYGEIKNSTQILIMSDEEITLNFPAEDVVVNSNFSDAEIYINEQSTGFIVKDKKEIGPLPIDGTKTMHLEKDFPWGRIKGEEVAVKDNANITLDINMENDKVKTDIDEVISEYYNGVFNALNEEDKDLIGNSTVQAQDKIYGILEKKYFILKNKYKINKINIIEENNEYSYKDGQFRATIVVDINYEIDKFLGIDKISNNKKFFTKLLYEDGGWKVEDVEDFSL